MTAVSDPVEPIEVPRPLRPAGLASWAVLWVVFIIAGALLGCVAATHPGAT